MQDKNSGFKLSENGIIYLSSGFDGPFIFQVIVSRQQRVDEFIFCLTDGILYIGGKYQGKLSREIRQYSIVEVQCQFISKWLPITINQISLISNDINYLMGEPPMTLHDYFLQGQKQSEYHQTETSHSFVKNEHSQKRREFKKYTSSSDIISEKRTAVNPKREPVEQKTQKRLKLEYEHDQQSKVPSQKPYSHQRITFADSVDGISNQNLTQIKERNYSSTKKYGSECATPKRQSISNKKVFTGLDEDILEDSYQLCNSFLEDLYERMPGWRILCRVNYLRCFVSAKGNKCLTLQLIDQQGCQRKAMYYYGTKGTRFKEDIPILQENKIYTFSDGDIVKQQEDTQLPIQLIFTQNSSIKTQPHVIIPAFKGKKMHSFQSLTDLPFQTEVSVIGIIKSIEKSEYQRKHMTQSQHQKIKIKGVICCPEELSEVQFYKNYFAGQSIPEANQICVLHNFKVVQASNAIKLSGSNAINRSYFSITSETQFPKDKANKYLLEYKIFYNIHEYLLPTTDPKWKNISYFNFSEVRYQRRTIKEILAVADTVECQIYSEILCSVPEIKVKRQYMGCPMCKRATQQAQAYLWHCIKCGTMVKPVPTLIIITTLSDSTGSFPIEVIGENAETLIGIDVNQFRGLTEEQKQCHLQMVRFQNFLIKLKSQKKKLGDLTSTIQQIKKQEHKMIVEEIRRRAVDQRLRNETEWDNSHTFLN